MRLAQETDLSEPLPSLPPLVAPWQREEPSALPSRGEDRELWRGLQIVLHAGCDLVRQCLQQGQLSDPARQDGWQLTREGHALTRTTEATAPQAVQPDTDLYQQATVWVNRLCLWLASWLQAQKPTPAAPSATSGQASPKPPVPGAPAGSGDPSGLPPAIKAYIESEVEAVFQARVLPALAQVKAAQATAETLAAQGRSWESLAPGQQVLQADVRTLDAKVTDLDTKVSGLDAKVDTLDTRVSGLEQGQGFRQCSRRTHPVFSSLAHRETLYEYRCLLTLVIGCIN